MKKGFIFVLIGSIFLFGCPEKPMEETPFQQIGIESRMEIHPNELYSFDCKLIPDDEVFAQWSFEVPDGVVISPLEGREGMNPSSFGILVSDVGDYSFTVIEEERLLRKRVEVHCRSRLVDFTLSQNRVVHWGDSFYPEEEALFDPPQHYSVDFEYLFESDLIYFDPEKKAFLAKEGCCGEVELLIRDRISQIEKKILVKVVEPFRQFDQLALSVAILKRLPQEVVAFLEQNQLCFREVTPDGVKVVEDYSVIAEKEGSWDLFLDEEWNGQKIPRGKINIVSIDWFSAEFEYHQRLKEEKQYHLINEEDLLQQLKKADSFSFQYEWKGSRVCPLDDGQTYQYSLKHPHVKRLYWAFHHLACKNSEHWKKNCPEEIYDSVSLSRRNISYYSVLENSDLQNSIFYRLYSTQINNDLSDQFGEIPWCHNASGLGNPNGSFKHIYYRYPYEQISEYPFLVEKMDESIDNAFQEAKRNFSLASHEIIWKKDERKQLNTAGTFFMKKNQDHTQYQKRFDQVPKKMTIPISSYSVQSNRFVSIVNNPVYVIGERTAEIDVIPEYPIINKIHLSWSNGEVLFQSVEWSLTEQQSQFFEKKVIENLSNREVNLYLIEKEIASDLSILNGSIAKIHFIDEKGNAFYKEINAVRE